MTKIKNLNGKQGRTSWKLTKVYILLLTRISLYSKTGITIVKTCYSHTDYL